MNTPERTYRDHFGGVSPDGTTLASGVYNGVTLWDVTSREEVAYLYQAGSPVALSDVARREQRLFYARYDAITPLGCSDRKRLTTLTGVSWRQFSSNSMPYSLHRSWRDVAITRGVFARVGTPVLSRWRSSR